MNEAAKLRTFDEVLAAVQARELTWFFEDYGVRSRTSKGLLCCPLSALQDAYISLASRVATSLDIPSGVVFRILSAADFSGADPADRAALLCACGLAERSVAE